MGTHTCIVSRAGSNASDTSTAVAFAWQVGPGSGANPVNAADFPGNAYPSGTGTIAVGAPSATITFQSNPDSTFESDETGALTVTTPQSGVTIIGSPQPFTITNDDADPGSGGGSNIYGPTSTLDTGPVDGGTGGYRISTTVYDTAWIAEVLGDNNTLQPCYRHRPADASTFVTGFAVNASGAETQDSIQTRMSNDSTVPGVPLVIEVTADGAVTLRINGKVVKGQYQNDDFYRPFGSLTVAKRFVRFRHGGSTPRTVTITTL